MRHSLLAGSLVASALAATAPAQAPQVLVPRIEAMPAAPTPLLVLDWRAKALCYDAYVFDETLVGDHLPLVWEDNARLNFPIDGFGMPSYVGHVSMTGGGAHEAITTISSVLGATLVGVDKSAQDGTNWVLPCQNYYNTWNGQNVVLNYTATVSGNSFWYELMPHILFYQLAERYPGFGASNSIVFNTASRWYAATGVMGGYSGAANFNHTAYNFPAGTPVDNGIWIEPDAAAGVAYLQYMAHKRYGQASFLQGSRWGLDFLEQSAANPLYEVLLPYGAYTAARMNAETGTTYDVEKLVNWCFSAGSNARPGWGVLVGDFNGYQVNGLIGSTTDRGGYAFAMNTFVYAGALVPMVRYDERFARAIGKWMLHASANARLFYKDQLPPANQSSFSWPGDPDACIPYEGLVKSAQGVSPRAQGDAVQFGYAATDFALYGGAYVGFFGAIIERTNVPEVLQLDCLATDFHTGPAYPTHLYYNPTAQAQVIVVDVGPQAVSLYDTVSDLFLTPPVSGSASFELAAGTAAVIVRVPAPSVLSEEGGRLLANGVVVDFNAAPLARRDQWRLF